MRISSVALAALLAACQQQPATAPREHAKPGTLIPCATGDAPLANACSVEIAKRPDGPLVTVRNPDGGFHRLLVTRDGRGLVAADGAQLAEIVTIDDRTIEVRLAGDRYRLPATVRVR